ncbi:MAG: TIR domain-containing protein [Woeseiaceae bacterium]|nr:TIR domain-containing protein [Woeseiaceae bacterium]
MNEQRFRARKVFVSYRRDGGQAHAVNLCQCLTQVLGEQGVFLDVTKHAMEVGRSWRTTVRATLSRCDSLLLVLDPGIAERLRDPDNAVRFEVETALQLGLRVVPVRVDNAVMPSTSDLPESLYELPDLHSPVIHPDAAIADVDRVVEWLTGIVPGTVKPLDRWDLAIVLGLAAIGAVAWITWARNLFSTGEAWLWGAALAMPWLLWMLIRRWLFVGGRARSAANRRHAAGWLVILIIFGAGWGLGWSAVYSIPEFPELAGVLASRLENDPDNEVQDELLDFLQADRQITDGVELPDLAMRLPRRVGFASRALPWLSGDNGHREARRFGETSGAAVVLWGTILDRDDAVPHIAAHLTFVGTQAVLQRAPSKVVGVVSLKEVDDLNGSIVVLGKALPRFLDGYRAFHGATDTSDLELARVKFRQALGTIDEVQIDADDVSALKDIRASVLFYLGNTDLALGRSDDAAAWFEQSMRESESEIGGITNMSYIHAANNLGWLQTKDGHHVDAIATFDTAEAECGQNPELRACAYLWYNRGDAEASLHNYDVAERQFNRAIERIEGRGIDETDTRLEAQSRQNLSYVLSRQAAVSTGSAKTELLARAESAWQSGEAVYLSHNLEMPEHHHITVARIHIERGEWQKAIELLTSIKVPDRRTTVEALLAGTYACVRDIDRQQASLQAMTVSKDKQMSIMEGMQEAVRIETTCP